MVWSFSWLHSWDEVWGEDNLPRWRDAFAPGSGAQTTPFMHPDVVRAWVRAKGEDQLHPFFLHGAHPGGQRALLLLVCPKTDWQRGFVRHLQSVGMNMFDYSDPIVLPAEGQTTALAGDFWGDLVREIGDRAGCWFDVCRFSRIRAHSLGRMPPDKLVAMQAAPFVRLDAYDDFEHYLRSRRKAFRSGLRRSAKHLAAEGKVRFRVHDPSDVDTVLSWIPRLIAEKRNKFPNSYPSQEDETYFTSLVTDGMPSGVVHCSSISLDGVKISWEINFYLDGVLYGYVCASSGEFPKLSLGSLHNANVIEWLFRQNGRVYDFMWGEEAYKYAWTDNEAVALYQLEMKSKAPASLLRRGAGLGARLLERRLVPGAGPILKWAGWPA